MGSPTNEAVNLVGLLHDSRGIGQVAQGLAACLNKLGVPHIDCDLSDMDDGATIVPVECHQLARVNLSVINPGELHWVKEMFGETFFLGKYNIGHWSWELCGTVPQSWKGCIDLFDEIWAPSRFIQQTFAEHFHLPTHVIHPIAKLNACTEYGASQFGLSGDEFVFLFVCDFKSSAERKNPIGLVRAFKQAFRENEKVRLVIKVSSGLTDPAYWQRLQKECSQANITLIDEIMPRAKLESLINICDSYVSLHRAEGFGMTLAEAMLAGRPVIATGWSGNLDFMNEENSYLVASELVEIGPEEMLYQSGQLWAEPNLQHAAECMRRVYENPSEAAEKAKLGAMMVSDLCSLDAVSQVVAQRLQEITAFSRALNRIALETKPCEVGAELETASVTEKGKGQFSLEGKNVSANVSSANQPDISVCLPVFNGANYLEEAIESVLQQSFKDFELLIADDRSTDNSLSIIEAYSRKDKRIRYWTNSKRLGLFSNYNMCISESRGTYIKPFAQDDVLDAKLLFYQKNVLDLHPAVSLVSADRVFINEMGRAFLPEDFEELMQFEKRVAKNMPVSGTEVINSCFFPVVNLIGEPSAAMFRKKDAGSGFDESLYHVGDLDYWFQLLLKGDYYRIEKPLCRFRRHATSATSRNVPSLLYAPDTLKLGKKFLSVLSVQGHCYESFLTDAIHCLAAQSLRMTDRDFYLGRQVVRDSVPKVDPCDFQELAFRALQFAGRGFPAFAVEDTKHIRQIEELEQELRELLQSPYWRWTKPLRDINYTLRCLGGASDVEVSPTLTEMGEYVAYLTDLKRAVLTSRSWRLTEPFRSLQGRRHVPANSATLNL